MFSRVYPAVRPGPIFSRGHRGNRFHSLFHSRVTWLLFLNLTYLFQDQKHFYETGIYQSIYLSSNTYLMIVLVNCSINLHGNRGGPIHSKMCRNKVACYVTVIITRRLTGMVTLWVPTFFSMFSKSYRICKVPNEKEKQVGIEWAEIHRPNHLWCFQFYSNTT